MTKNSVLKGRLGNDLFSGLKLHFTHTWSGQVGLYYVIAFLLALSGWSVAQTPPTNSSRKTIVVADLAFRLSPEAMQVADVIGVLPLLNRLEILPVDHAANDATISLESLVLRQEITERVLATSLDADSVNALIDTEIEQTKAIRSDLQARRDKAQNIINVASLVAGGALGVVNTALQFNSRTANLGNGIGVGGGAASVVLSIVGIHKQGGGRRGLGDSPRMLARFFDRLPNTTEVIRSEYPEEIWSYLNSVALLQPAKGTHREQLIAKWHGEGRIEQDGSAKSERRNDALSGNILQARRLNIGELDDHLAMLQNVRARVLLMKRDLGEILRGLSVRQSSQ